MNKITKILLMTAGIIIAIVAVSQAQNTKPDDDRMNRDIEVAENILSTLIRQQLNKRNFFPIEVEGSYLPGFGVTFRLPQDMNNQLLFMSEPGISYSYSDGGNQGITVTGYGNQGDGNFSGTAAATDLSAAQDDCEDCPKTNKVVPRNARATVRTRRSVKNLKTDNSDSTRMNFNTALIQASKNFIADYGDVISQLGVNERIVITNKIDRSNNVWFWKTNNGQNSTYLSLEAMKADLTTYKQGKINRDQFLAKIKVINTETTEDLSPDLELLSSIFNRLYRPDLSRTYFIQEDVYYDRLKDYGAIYEMHVYSSTGADFGQYDMPTIGLRDVDKAERYKKVKELYPAFEKSLLDDILEYGKTLKSLKENELLVFNVKLTECKGCGIPSSIEVSFKDNVLKDYSSGKLTKDAALAKVTIKKGLAQ